VSFPFFSPPAEFLCPFLIVSPMAAEHLFPQRNFPLEILLFKFPSDVGLPPPLPTPSKCLLLGPPSLCGAIRCCLSEREARRSSLKIRDFFSPLPRFPGEAQFLSLFPGFPGLVRGRPEKGTVFEPSVSSDVFRKRPSSYLVADHWIGRAFFFLAGRLLIVDLSSRLPGIPPSLLAPQACPVSNVLFGSVSLVFLLLSVACPLSDPVLFVAWASPQC